MRLDVYVAKQWPEQSRSTWQKLIQAGYVRVNGKVEKQIKRDVTETDSIEATPPQQPSYDDMKLPIIYEDNSVIVIDKPVGVLTHSKGAVNQEFTVAEFVRPLTDYKQETNRPGIIHRLDRATSGVLLCVKTNEAAAYIAKQFTNRTTKKHYMAVVSGVPNQLEAMIDLPIERNPSAPSTFRVGPGGKSAETYYKVLTSNDEKSLIDLKPKTGRTHQLRVHMAYLGTPIVGDPVYGSVDADRMYLHAASLEVTLPGGERKVFSSPLPASFKSQVA